MSDTPPIAEAGALIGDPARANMLACLMDGKARTATELAYVARVSPQTASAHLAKLTGGRLLAVERQGRHRYFRLASPEVADVLEALTLLAVEGPRRHRPPGPRDEAVRAARTCYDHIAGRLGVGLCDRLHAGGYLLDRERGLALSAHGERFLGDFGVDLTALRRGRRPLLRACLDWSERRPHLAGAVGAALADRCFALGWVERVPDSRALRVTSAGDAGLRDVFRL